VEPIRASSVGRLSRIRRYEKTVDCGRKGYVETAGPVDEALIGLTGKLSRSGNYAKTIDRGREGSVETPGQSKPSDRARDSNAGLCI